MAQAQDIHEVPREGDESRYRGEEAQPLDERVPWARQEHHHGRPAGQYRGDEQRLPPDGCVGIIATGGLTLQTFRHLIENLPEGTWEFVTHPGYNDAELNNVNTRLRHSRENELSILTSSEVKKLLQREQIELISYREFVTTHQVSPEVLSPSAGAK